MALGPNRHVYQYVRPLFAVNAAQERGGILCADTSTAGQALYVVSPTGSDVRPLGLQMDDVESMNFDRHPEYLQRNVVDIGSVVGICNKGEFQTNLIVGTPAQGQKMYLHPTGYVGPSQLTDGLNPAPLVGKFLSAKDANGYAHVLVDI